MGGKHLLCFVIITLIFILFSQKRTLLQVQPPEGDINKMGVIKYDSQPHTCIVNEKDVHRKFSSIRAVNRPVTDVDPLIEQRFQRAIDAKLKANDPVLIQLASDMMDWPSAKTYRFSMRGRHTPQSNYTMSEIFHDMKNGFFVEVGALDGERSSNTRWMEESFGWTGLLIEADSYYYTQLLGKNRNSWSINACLSPSGIVEWLDYIGNNGGGGKVATGDQKTNVRVPCFALETLLLAINRTQVDFFSLDVEGFEIDILETTPLDKLDIKTFTIEYDKVGEEVLKTFMEQRGYRTVQKIDYTDWNIHMHTKDLVFVKI